MTSPLEIAGNAISAVYNCKVSLEDRFSIEMLFSDYKKACRHLSLMCGGSPQPTRCM